MKKNGLGGVAFLVFAALLAAWFEWSDGDSNSPGSSSNSSEMDYILALSWQPAFCEMRPNKPECRSQRSGRFDVSNFSLHGLWPQPRNNLYCGVPQNLEALDKAGRWGDLPKLELTDDLRRELAQKMPGYRSYLHRHEWIKHGTCIPSITPQQYFEVSLRLLNAFNESALADMVRSNINRRLNIRELDLAYSKDFGPNAGTKLVANCHRDDGRRIYRELKLSLSGDILSEQSLSAFIASAPELGSSCPSGIVDPVGLQ